jgi:hypothetical protein
MIRAIKTSAAHFSFVRRIQRLMIAAVVSVCGCAPAQGGSPSFSELQAGDRIHISYYSRGCFHERKYEIDFEGGTSVTARSSGNRTTLSTAEVAGLDRLLQFYRSRPRGGCTTEDKITISRFHDGRKIDTEHYVDGSCAAFDIKGVTQIYQVAEKLGLNRET